MSEFFIENQKVSISLGDMTKVKADAYLVPEFNTAASFGGVGGAIARAGATMGLELYQEHVDKNGQQPFGQVVLTPSGGGNAPHLLHVVSVGSGEENEFSVIQTCVYNVLRTAEENGIGKIVIPALGTGIIGRLTDEQSAKAMMSAIHRYASEGGQPLEIAFVLFAGQPTLNSFENIIKTKAYENVSHETGERDIDLARWVFGMNGDAAANQKYAQDLAQKGATGKTVKLMKPLVIKKKSP